MNCERDEQMYKLTLSKSLLVKMSALAASALIMAACTATTAPATGAATPATQAEATATTESTTTEATATTEAPSSTEAMTSTEATTSTETTAPSTEVTSTTGTTETTEPSSTEETTSTEEMTSTEGMSQTGNVEAGPPVVNVADSEYGKILVAGNGMTLYVFDKDTEGKSNCNGNCLIKWPALVASDEDAQVTADPSITGTFSIITRDDGSYQVAINGLPLYYYQPDTKPGDTTGQAVGDVWWVVGTDGNKITTQ
jgi:predicted lipoprotein with Yx(FWY)xxD motif